MGLVSKVIIDLCCPNTDCEGHGEHVADIELDVPPYDPEKGTVIETLDTETCDECDEEISIPKIKIRPIK